MLQCRGGRILAEESIGERINIKRVRMAVDTGAEVLLSNCPFCLTMFEDGVKGADVEASLKTKRYCRNIGGTP